MIKSILIRTAEYAATSILMLVMLEAAKLTYACIEMRLERKGS